ncbi:MAG: DUF5063 domain-containing protein, partial [Bacteroidales bacterium]|nr:DUF5063 domain-containing protein [Bacteroidales bacterium]
MNEDAENKILHNEQVTEFVTRAAEYCTFVENTGNFSKRDFIRKALSLLSEIYTRMMQMPPLENATDAVNEKYVTENDWNTIYQKVSTKLGYHNDYLDIFDPVTKEEEEVSVASLGDNFADIYQDMKDFITLYSMGNEEVMTDALWECQMNFEEYWGHKVLNALRILHRIYFGGEDLEEESEEQGEEQDSEEQERDNWLFKKKQEQYNPP